MLPLDVPSCPLSPRPFSLQALSLSRNPRTWRGRHATQMGNHLDLGQVSQHSGGGCRWGRGWASHRLGCTQRPDGMMRLMPGYKGRGVCATEGPGHLGVSEDVSEEAAGGGEGRRDDCSGKSLWSFLASAGRATSFSPTGCLPESLPTHQQIKKGYHLLANGPD